MAHNVTITNLQDGPRKAIFLVALQSDGASGELVDYLVIDYSAMGVKMVAVEELSWSFNSFDTVLEFDGLITDQLVWTMPRGNANPACFRSVGGISDTTGMDSLKKLAITTTGFSVPGAQGAFFITIRKSK